MRMDMEKVEDTKRSACCQWQVGSLRGSLYYGMFDDVCFPRSCTSHGKVRTTFLAFIVIAFSGVFVGCSTVPKALPSTVEYVDLERYVGRWYVISHVPYFLEKGKVASYDTYSRRPDGKLVNNFTFRQGSIEAPEKTWHGIAWVTDSKSNASWKVQFVWPLAVTYKIFALDTAYRWAVVGTGDAGLLWVLARERRIDSDTYSGILEGLRAKGIDPAMLAMVPQPTE